MSLIVQVNSSTSSGNNAAPPPTPAGGGGVQPSPQPPAGVVSPSLAVKKPQPSINRGPPPTTLMTQPSTLAITSIAEQQTQQQHIVQHHPPPLGAADARLRMIQVPHPPLPQSPVRPSALPPQTVTQRAAAATTAAAALRLPQSPVRQHHLTQQQPPQNVVSAAHQRILAQQTPQPPQPRSRHLVATAAVAAPRQPPPAHHLSMLPQSPSPNILPTAPSPNILSSMPFPPPNLVPQPMTSSAASKIIQQQLLSARPHPMAVSTAGALTIRGPLTQSRARRRTDSNEELEVGSHEHSHQLHSSPASLPGIRQPMRAGQHNSLNSPKARPGPTGGRNQIWQCTALQDHNYASRPPPTPPPSPAAVAAAQQQQQQEAAAIVAAAAAAHAAHPNTVLFNQTSLTRGTPQQQQPPQPPQPRLPTIPSPGSFSSTFGIAATDLLAAAALANSSPPPPPAHLQHHKQPPVSLLPPPPPAAAIVTAATALAAAAPPTPPTREQQNSSSIEEAGVGPMTPLVEAAVAAASAEAAANKTAFEDAEERIDGGHHSPAEGGEETETAPEADIDDDDDEDGVGGVGGGARDEDDEDDDDDYDDDDSITRCICDFLHDDGYMICCDKCSVWQHVVCMGLDRNNIPEEYLCEVCKPRTVDRKRARAMQSRRRNEIFHNSSSSDNENAPTHTSTSAKMNTRKKTKKKILDRKVAGHHQHLTETKAFKQHSHGGTKQHKVAKVAKPSALDLLTSKKVLTKEDRSKKQYRKKKAAGADVKNVNSKKASNTRKLPHDSGKMMLVDEDSDEVDEGMDSDQLLEPRLDASQHLRSWIDQYEEAITNHYSPELRARLAGNKLSGIASDLRPSVIGGPVKCNVSLKGNGVKILTASVNLPANTPIIECKGRLMLASHYRAQSSPVSKAARAASSVHPPYVFFYHLSDSLEICLDGKTYGNDARFCRRAPSRAQVNAELRHVVDKGSLHLFIVATRSIEKNEEILLLLETSTSDTGEMSTIAPNSAEQPLQSINADLREIKKPNGMVLMNSSSDETHREKKLKQKKKKKKKKVLKKSSKEKSSRKSRNLRPLAGADEEDDEEEERLLGDHSENNKVANTSTVNGEVGSNSPPSPTKAKPSPPKLGLPDSSGLIVGVNTINYDASSSLRNKSKSREERKMEMIMKAIEAMEKAEQRKKEQSDAGHHSGSDKPSGGKRRRSNSSKNNSQNTDSALDASSADEGRNDHSGSPSKKTARKKSGRKGGGGAQTPQRRRSRVVSGGSASALSENEAFQGGCDSSATPNTANSNSGNGPFRFPKTKKTLMSDWLQEASGGGADEVDDDDVSGSYLRGSRSPPGIATHLLRAAPHSPVKSVCSAKKRWLRQAISEDHSEEQPKVDSAVSINGGNGGVVAAVDYVTPLKKRRLASYKDDQSQEEVEATTGGPPAGSVASGEEAQQPNSLKKKLLHNLVLEAVLDKAVEDMLGSGREISPDTTAPAEVKEEEEVEEPEHQQVARKKKKKAEAAMEVSETKPVTRNRAKHSESKDIVPPSTETSSTSKSKRAPSPSAPSVIKTPEPSSVFKNFFKSTVSIEELEAEIEATKKQRQSGQQSYDDAAASAAGKVVSKPEVNDPPMNKEECQEINEAAIKKEDSSVTSCKVEHSEDVKVVVVPFRKRVSEDESNESAFSKTAAGSTSLSVPPVIEHSSIKKEEDDSSTQLMPSAPKPKEKRRVSVAEYKRRRKQDTTSSQHLKGVAKEVWSSNKSAAGASANKSDEPGTPTLDEQIAGLTSPPTLSTLPLFQKLEKLEQAHKANKKKVQSSSPKVEAAVPEPKREDLAERLKKEFGVTVDDEVETKARSAAGMDVVGAGVIGSNLSRDDGDATPELDGASRTPPPPPLVKAAALPKDIPTALPPALSGGGPPHPPPSKYGYLPSSSGAAMTGKHFTPTQYPSYPSNYPLPPYPKSGVASPHKYPTGPPHPPPPPPPPSAPSIGSYPQSASSAGSFTGQPPSVSSSVREDKSRREFSSYSSSHSPRGYYTSEQRRLDANRDRDLRRDHHRDSGHHHHRDSSHHHHHHRDYRDRSSRSSRYGDRGSSSYHHGRGYYGSSQ